MARFDAGTIEAILRLRDEFTGVAALGVGALKAAIDFESSFAGVIKTVDDATDSMGRLTPVGEALKQSFRDLALEIPISANELAGIGEVAGQLGIETQNIAGFTETMAKLGVTTNLSAEEAATSLARLANVTGLPQTEFERLGSTVVALGNNLATTESEIVMFGQRIAGAGAIAGLSEPQILAIGAAMSSVGIEAEAGGTAVQKVLLTMNDAVAAGGAELVRFADLSGQSVEQFAAGWRDNAGAQFTAFVEGLAQQGDQASAVLKDLIGTDQRLQRAFLSLAESGDTLRNAMSLANIAWVENTALAKEAEIRFQTTSAELTILWNNVKDVAISLGDALLPTLKDAVGFLQESVVPVLRDAAKWFEDLSPASKRLAAGFAALIVVATPVLFTLSTMAPLLSVIAGGFAALVPRAAAASAAVGASGAAAAASVGPMVAAKIAARNMWRAISGPVGIAIAVITAAVGAFKLLKRHIDEGSTAAANFARSQASVDSMTAAIAKLESEGKKVSQRLRDVLTDAEQTRDRMKEMAGSVDETSESFTAMRDELKALAAKDMATWANASEEAKKRALELADALPDTEVAMKNLVENVRLLQSESELTPSVLRNIAKQALALGIAVEDLPPELKNIVVSFDNVTRAGRDATEEEARLERETTRLKESIQELVDQFQGRGLIASAEQAAEAVRHVGGVSKLTAEQQNQLRETVDGAMDAYRRLEQTAPQAVRHLGDELNALDDVRALARLQEDVQSLINTWTGADLKSEALVAAFETLTAEQLANDRVMAQMIGSYDSMREILGPFHAELEQLWQTHERLKTPLESNTDLTDRLMQAQIAATQAQAALNERLDAHRRALLNLPTDQAITAFEALRMTWDELSESERTDATEAYSAALKQAAESGIRLTAEEAALVGQAAGMNWVDGFFGTLSRAFEGGGGFTDALGKLFSGGGVLGKIVSVGTKIGSGIGKFMSLGLNGVPIVGPFLAAFGGPLLKGVGKLFKKMFGGPSEAELAGRKVALAFRDAVTATLTDGQLAEAAEAALGAWRGNEQGAQFLIGVRDAYLSVGRSAAEAEAMVIRLWQAEERGPEAVAAVQREMQLVLDQAADLRAQFEQIAELQTFDSATDQLQQLTSAAEFFGVEADEMGERLGNAFKAVEQAATAEDIAQHFHTLLASGVDLGTALDLAKDKVQGVITASVQMGTEIPAAMQPIAAQLIAQGQLLDESGKQITDINQLEFGTSMTEGLQILVLSMNQLIETMGGEIPAAAKKFAQGVGDGARDAEQTLRDTILAQVENIGLAVHDLSVEELAQMATAFETTALAAGLSLEGALGEKLDALTTGLGSMSRDALPELVRSFQQTATDATLAFDRIPRTLTFDHHTRYSSSGSPGATNRSGLQSGTHGRFVDFGGGTSVVLHGRERVVTEAEGRREASDLGALRKELADLKRIMARGQDELPFRMSRAIRDAMAETG